MPLVEVVFIIIALLQLVTLLRNATPPWISSREFCKILLWLSLNESCNIQQFSKKKGFLAKNVRAFSFKSLLWDSFNGVDAFTLLSFQPVCGWWVYGRDMVLSWNLQQRCPWRDDIWWPYQITNQLYRYKYRHTANRFLILSTKIENVSSSNFKCFFGERCNLITY